MDYDNELKKIQKIKEDCETCGGSGYSVVDTKGVWAVLWSTEVADFHWHFKHEQDLLFFKLKWA